MLPDFEKYPHLTNLIEPRLVETSRGDFYGFWFRHPHTDAPDVHGIYFLDGKLQYWIETRDTGQRLETTTVFNDEVESQPDSIICNENLRARDFPREKVAVLIAQAFSYGRAMNQQDTGCRQLELTLA